MSDLATFSTSQNIELFDHLYAEKGTFNNYFQDVTDLILPSKSNVNRKATMGESRGLLRYDSTAPQALETLGAFMKDSITSADFQWFKLMLREKALNDNQDVREWLDDCADRMYDEFNASNFNSQDNEGYLDLGGYGTTAMSIMAKDQDEFGKFAGLIFRTWPIGEYVFLENEEGIADTILRKFEKTAYQAKQLWPDDNLGESVENAAKSDVPADKAKKFQFLHVIFPRFTERKGTPTAQSMPFGSVYIAVKDQHKIREGGFQELPVAITRWLKASDDNGWGRGPGLNSLPDIKSLNKMKEMALKAVAKDIDPPIIAQNKGVVGAIRTGPSGVTFVKANKRLEHWNSGTRMDSAVYNIDDYRRTIENAFYIDKLISPSEPEGTKMTAYEVKKRLEMMQRLLGPVLGRIMTERLTPIVFRVFNVMLRGGAFLQAPAVLAEMAEGPTLDIDFIGPLARAQKSQDIDAIDRVYLSAAEKAEMTGDPSILDNLNNDEAIKHEAEIMGVPAKILRSESDRDELRQKREQAQADQAQIDQATQLAGASKAAR